MHGSKKIQSVFISVICMWMLISLNIFTASASDSLLDIKIPVRQMFLTQSASVPPSAQHGKYVLSSEGPNMPMPEGSQDEQHEFSITGNNRTSEIHIPFSKTGIYHYTLKQITEDTDNYVYDRIVYTITVYIENSHTGDLSSQIIVENDEMGKCAEICFENQYKNNGNSLENPPATGDQTNILLWASLSLSSLIIGCVLIIIYRKQVLCK